MFIRTIRLVVVVVPSCLLLLLCTYTYILLFGWIHIYLPKGGFFFFGIVSDFVYALTVFQNELNNRRLIPYWTGVGKKIMFSPGPRTAAADLGLTTTAHPPRTKSSPSGLSNIDHPTQNIRWSCKQGCCRGTVTTSRFGLLISHGRRPQIIP